MQFSPSPDTGPGAAVLARGRRWWVAAQDLGTSARLAHLVPASPPRGARVLIDPADAITPLPGDARPRVVSRRRWMRALAGTLTEVMPTGEPVSAAGADVRLLPFQLEPLLAIQRGRTARILIADAVGLGKTIQAALIVRELLARQPTARVLIVVPAGLRAQWCHELVDRTGLAPEAVDAARLAQLAAGLPPGASPWTTVPLAVISLDLLKQPDIVSGLAGATWDLCIVDEAHLLTPGTARARAAATVAAHSLRVALLTATPHDGDDGHYAALCGIGRLWPDEPLVVFSRSRTDAALAGAPAPPRHRRLHVRPGHADVHVQSLLTRYVARVWNAGQHDQAGARLAMTLLVKRAASGAWALARSLERRLQLLESTVPADAAMQRSLFTPAGDDVEADDLAADDILAVPGLPPAQERVWLRLLMAAAAAAVPADRKLAALRRLLRRTTEPVIVFTEYRDTLMNGVDRLRGLRPLAVLHGGLTPDARREAVSAFADGRATLLVATDAASLGLNLHHRCRLVVHLELPWSPLRLAQRVGRVDRLGQGRRVHAIELVWRGSLEARVALRLDERRARIASARGTLAGPAEREPTAWLADAIAGETPPESATGSPEEPDSREGTPEAAALVARLERRRRLLRVAAHDTRGRPLVCRLSGRARLRLGLPSGVLGVFVRRDADAMGERSRDVIATLWSGPLPPWPPRRAPRAWAAIVAASVDAVRHTRSRSDDEGLVARRARVIAREAAARRRAEQLALFPERVAATPASANAGPLDAASRHQDRGPISCRSAELALLLVLE